MLEPPLPQDPWPDDYNPADGDTQRFEPDRRRFADVPVLVRIATGFDILRGSVSPSTLQHAAQELAQLPAGTRVGAFPDDPLVELVVEGEPVLDMRYRSQLVGPRMPQGLDSLEQLIDALRAYAGEVVEFANRLQQLHADGWVLDSYEAGETVNLVDTRYAQREK